MRTFLLLLALALLAPGIASADEAAWAALRRGEAAAIIRHALAPGVGDPAGFRLEDCATQRNLSDDGRAQARRVGERLRQAGLKEAEVRHSRWCRARETAELLGLGTATPLPALDSHFGRAEAAGRQGVDLRRFLAERVDRRPLVLVSHQVNISALTGVHPSSGEVVIFDLADPRRVLLRLPPD